MADKKISDFTAASSIADNDYIEIETAGGNSRKVTGANAKLSLSPLVLLSEVVTTSSATNVSFTSFSAGYRDLEVRVRGRGTKSATQVDIRIRFNGDTGGNYDNEFMQGIGSSILATNQAAQTSGFLGNMAAASAPSGVGDFLQLMIGDYRGTTFQKAAHWIGGAKGGTSAGNFNAENGSIWWRSTSAITQIDVFPSSNAFVDDSVVSLYGRL